MFPGRFWVALGSGEASNEHITGDGWPRKEMRTQRLEECVDVIRRMLHGEEVSHDGLVTVDRARLWELPDPVPELVGPAVSVESAARVAAWADGLVTVNQPMDVLRDIVDGLPRRRRPWPAGAAGAPVVGRRPRTEALRIAHEQWGGNVFGPPISWDIETAEAFDVLWKHVAARGGARRPSTSRPTSASTATGWRSTPRSASTRSTCTTSGRTQAAFIDAFGEHVLPELRKG